MVAQSGSRQKWPHANGRQVIVEIYGNKPIPIGTLKSIIGGSGLDVAEFRWICATVKVRPRCIRGPFAVHSRLLTFSTSDLCPLVCSQLSVFSFCL
jgi:hypothetical protein